MSSDGPSSTVPVDLAVRAGLAGLASGMRTFTGFAAVAIATPRPAGAPVDRVLGLLPIRLAVGLAAASEIVSDKLPRTPDRRRPLTCGARVLAGAVTGAAMALRLSRARHGAVSTVALSATIGALGAATTTLVGPIYRAAMSERFGTDAAGATIEDLAAVGLAALAVRPT